MSLSPAEQKRRAAQSAVEAHLRDGIDLALGTGTTAEYVVDIVADLCRARGWAVRTCSTSEATEAHAIRQGLHTDGLDSFDRFAVAIDGADEVDCGLCLIKGGGGCLLREKYVEVQADRLVIVVDASKKVDVLGTTRALPVEVIKFGWHKTAARLQAQWPHVGIARREASPGQPFITDEGNYILDLDFTPHGIPDPRATAAQLKATVGVIEHGLFQDLATECHIAYPDGRVEVLRRPDGEHHQA
eukprot:EG_transcript_20009